VHHAAGVAGGEDVAVAQNGHGVVAGVDHVLLQACDLRPVGRSGVALGGGARVQGDGDGAIVRGDAAGVEVRVVVVVDADAELHGDGDVGAFGGADGGGDDVAEQAPLVRQGGTAAAA